MDIVTYCIFINPYNGKAYKAIRVARENKCVEKRAALVNGVMQDQSIPQTGSKPNVYLGGFPYYTEMLEVSEEAYNAFEDEDTRPEELAAYDRRIEKYFTVVAPVSVETKLMLSAEELANAYRELPTKVNAKLSAKGVGIKVK